MTLSLTPLCLMTLDGHIDTQYNNKNVTLHRMTISITALNIVMLSVIDAAYHK